MNDRPAGSGIHAAGTRAGDVLSVVERRTSLTPTGVVVAALAVIGWVVAYLAGSRVLFLMAYAGIGLLLALALLRRPAAITATRSHLPARIRERQTVPVEIEISAARRFNAIVIEDVLDGIRRPVRLLVPSLGPEAPVSYRYAITPSRRGVYRIGPLAVVWSDPFGLTRRRSVLLPAEEVIVHPVTESVHDRVLSREWEDPPIRPPVSKPWPTGFEFYGMRDYIPGDDPRRIVWRAVARTGRYLVREAEQGITDRVVIMLDTNRAAHGDEDPSETFETAVRAVASLGRLHLREGFVVTLETPGSRLATSLRGQRAEIALLDEMARVARGRQALDHGLQRVLRDARRDTHYIVVTPSLDHRSAGMLRLLLDRGASVTLVHVVAEEVDPMSLRRAAALGCEIVELRPGAALEAVFRRALGAGIRR